MKLSRAILAICASLVFSAGWVGSVEAARTWRTVRTPNFLVIGAQSEKSLRELAVELERFREVILRLLPQSPPSFNEPARVVIFPDRESFYPFRPRLEGKQRDVGGYFVAGTPPFLVVNGRQWQGNSAILFHEYLHYVVTNNANRLPAWLNEGLAEFYSTFKITKDGSSAQIGRPVSRHIRTLKERGFMPLDKLFEVKSGSGDYRDVRFYAQSWIVTHYLLLGPRYDLTRKFSYFLNILNAGLPLDNALAKAFETDREKLNSEMRDYVRGVTLPALKLNFPGPVEFSGTTQGKELSKAEELYHFGELHRRIGNQEKAERHFRESLEHNPALSESLVGLAVLKRGEPSEALSLLDRALKTDPESYLAHYLKGVLQMDGAEVEQAAESFQAAVRRNPNWANGHVDVGLTLLLLGEEERAQKAFQEAIRLAPFDPSIYYRRSFVLFQIGKTEEAATDAAVFARKWGIDDHLAPYMGFIVHFAQRRRGDAEAARKTLAAYTEGKDLSNWPFPVYEYLQGRIGGDELIGRTPEAKLTESHAYIGLDLLLKGETEPAIEHLTWVEKNGNRRFAEYDIAVAELRRIRQ